MAGLFDFISGGDKQAQNYLQQALQAYQNIAAPTQQQLSVNNLPMESVQGNVTPQQLQPITENLNQVQGVSLNPAAMQTQTGALGQFQDIANAGGLDADAKLAIQQAAQAANTNLAGNLGAIMQNAQAQGNANSGAVLGERLQAAQQAANNLQNQDLQAAAEAENNRQQAVANVANIGANMAGQNLNADTFNANNRNQVLAQNTATQNAAANTNVANNLGAQQFNVSNAQNVNAANTGAGQQQAYYNASVPQQMYQNQLAKAGGMAGIYGQQAGQAAQNSANNLNFLGSVLGSAGKVAAAGMAPGGAAKATGAAKGGLMLQHFLAPRKAGLIPGREVVRGNSQRNDMVPANLSAGEVVIPKEVPKDTKHIKEFMKNAPIAGTDKKVDLESFFSKKGK